MRGPSRFAYVQLAGATLLGTYALMLLGAYTSAIGAGLACPDWPSCYGTLVPFLHPDVVAASPYSARQIFAEWAHRGLAVVVGLGIVLTGLLAIRRRTHGLITWSALGAVALLPVQVLLGGLTVTRDLQPIVVVSHLGIAVLIVLCLLTTTVTAYLVPSPQGRTNRAS